MTRDLTHAEKSSLFDDGRCPFCASTLFFEGPHGGINVIWSCITPSCEARFNLAPAALWLGYLVRAPRSMPLARALPIQFRSVPEDRPNVRRTLMRTFLPWRNDGTRG